jgi:Coenzyme PQQ synthesis protein D (PqqD)
MILPEHVRSAHSEDGAILLDIRRGKMFRINFVGSRVVELLRAGLSESEIVERLAMEFACERAAVATDVRQFLEQLRQYHLFDNRQNESPAVG